MDDAKLAEGKELYFRKVIYCPKKQREWIESYLGEAISAIRTAKVSMAEAGILSLRAVNIILDMLLCFKHPAFAEEDEWRLFRATLENHEPEGLRFRVSAGLRVPYRPMFLFDAQKDGCAKFPLHSITFGPTLGLKEA